MKSLNENHINRHNFWQLKGIIDKNLAESFLISGKFT